MTDSELNWKVAGFAGQGVKAIGELFSRVMVRHGWYTFDYTEFPSLIKGGHNTYQVHTSKQPVYSQVKKVDVLLALNKNALIYHKDELHENSIIIYDGENENVDINSLALPGKVYSVPFLKIAREIGGNTLYANNTALGAVAYFLGIDLQIVLDLIAEVFAKKKEEVIKINQKVATAGFEAAQETGQKLISIEKQNVTPKYLLNGNESVALGALAGGLQFYAAYPMPPSTGILEYLAETASQLGTVVKHCEDEISVATMALGASFAGARTMVASSGGGLAYMVEAFGAAGICELPLVFVDCQRPGPALGMPTWTAQGDLRFLLHASQDEFLRIILTPGTAQEAFDLSKLAMHLSEKYQLPVFILSDKYLAESRFNCDNIQTQHQNTRIGIMENPTPDANGFFPRYYPTNSGVSFRTLPGTPGGTYICNAYEHNKYGFGVEDSETRTEQLTKRARKIAFLDQEIPTQYQENTGSGNLGVISFGSTFGPVKAARELLKTEKIETNQLHLSWIWPFPTKQVLDFIDSCNGIVVVEGNSEGQLAGLITQTTCVPMHNTINRFDGRPFYPEELSLEIKKFI